MIGSDLVGRLVLAWLLLNLAGWLIVRRRNLDQLRETPRLAPPVEPWRGEAPRVSILVPARNEADRILSESVSSMLAVSYPNLEVIAVDDRSTDSTAKILHALAATDSRLRVIDGLDPPPGWLGKIHALHQALAKATGDWVLATDADMIFDPDLLTAAMRAAAEHDAELVTLVPRDSSGVWSTALVMPVAVWMILSLYPPPATNDPRDRRALGVGGFLLMRRARLEALGGYAAIAGDIADDVGLAERFKQVGHRLFCAFAPDLLATPMYRSLGELWAGFSKNAMRGVDHDLGRALAAALLTVAISVLPALVALGSLLALASGSVEPWLLGVSWAAFAAQAAAFAPIYREYGVGGAYGWFAPWGFTVMTAVLLNGAWRALTGQGIDWRGREVPPRR